MTGPTVKLAPERPKRLRILTHRELREAAQAQPGGWLWHDVLPSTGMTLLYGGPHTFKSTLIAALAAAIEAEPEPPQLAGRPVQAGVMAIAALEHTDRDWSTLLDEAASGAGLPYLLASIIRPPFDIFDDADVAALAEHAEQIRAGA